MILLSPLLSINSIIPQVFDVINDHLLTNRTQPQQYARCKKMLDPGDEIVIHCSNPLCSASIIGYQILEHNGYKKIRRYAGGLQDWEEAGYTLEGSLVN